MDDVPTSRNSFVRGTVNMCTAWVTSPSSLARRRTHRTALSRTLFKCSASKPDHLLSIPSSKRANSTVTELADLANAVRKVCISQRWPAPESEFPSREDLRRVDPTLCNRIEAVRGRDGFRRVAKILGVRPPPVRRRKQRGQWDTAGRPKLSNWRDPSLVRQSLSTFQQHTHPNVLPPTPSLSEELRAVIRRYGGPIEFAQKFDLIRETEWSHIARFQAFLQHIVHMLYQGDSFLASPGLNQVVNGDDSEYVLPPKSTWTLHRSGVYLPPLPTRIRRESLMQHTFPETSALADAGLHADVRRFGGRRGLSARLGFARCEAPYDVFMGPFSISLAAELLWYATRVSCIVVDGDLGMPSCEQLEKDGFEHLVEPIRSFGGSVEVGRRIGLVPVDDARAHTDIEHAPDNPDSVDQN